MHDFIRIPPDSTGKKIRHIKRLDIEINTILVDLKGLEKGQLITGKTSGYTGFFMGFGVLLGETYIFSHSDGLTFLDGEILVINGTDIATVVSSSEHYTPGINITDPDIPNNQAKVDSNGSIYTRYSEGDLGFDAFGNAQFSETTQIDHHLWTYGDHPDKYWDDIQGTAAITASIADSSLVLSVDNLSGSKAARTSHQYYPYNPGEGNVIEMSIRTGDEGKAGVVRRWGLYDELDGMYFELHGTDFHIKQRSSTSGVAVDTEVLRADLNGDSLDDLNTSEYILQFSKYNLYWIDFQWLGVGKVRMGTFSPSGKRVTVHTFQNPNAHIVPYMKRGTLPFKMEIFNETDTASSSELRSVCTTIARQSANVTFPGEYITYNVPTTNIPSGSSVVLISAKPMVTYNGQVNRTTVIPTDFEVYTDGDPIRLDIITNSSISGSTYTATINPLSSTLIDTDGVTSTGGTRKETIYCPTGVYHRELDEVLYNSLKLSADGITQPIFSVVATCMKSTGTANVNLLMRWKESR